LLDLFTRGLDDQHKHHYVFVLLLDVPMLMMIVGSFFLLVQAATITETCNRASAVINSADVTTEDATNPVRLNVVSFIRNSQAGFSVRGTQLNATVLMKYCYLCGAVICAMFTSGVLPSKP